jgi:hypothetical protein
LLPFPHAGWLESILGAKVPEEQTSTCNSCPMIAPDPLGAPRFPGELKCCTFVPDLPSFQVGALLADADPRMDFGRERVLERIRAGLAVSPLGVGKSRTYLNLYGQGGFAASRALRCPYYRDGGCGIWLHRETICSTWFCKHDRGARGFAFWQAASFSLKAVELVVAVRIAIELGIDEEALTNNPLADVHREAAPEYYASLWAGWAGRETAYFVAAGERVTTLSFAEVDGWLRDQDKDLFVAAREAFAVLGGPLPDVVRLGKMNRVGDDATIVRFRSYSDYNPVDLPRAVADALPDYAGHPVADLAALGLGEAEVRRLVDHHILLIDEE